MLTVLTVLLETAAVLGALRGNNPQEALVAATQVASMLNHRSLPVPLDRRPYPKNESGPALARQRLRNTLVDAAILLLAVATDALSVGVLPRQPAATPSSPAEAPPPPAKEARPPPETWIAAAITACV